MNWKNYFFYFEKIGSRYFIVAGLAFILFYFLIKNSLGYKKIQNRFPAKADYIREILYSVVTISIFALVPLFILQYPPVAAHTFYYTKISEHGWIWFFAAFPIMFIIHDAYFYFTHRLMHHKTLFRYFHLVHHHSTNPSPWAAYAFHPLEALVEAGIFGVFLFIMPIHKLHLLIFFFLMIVYNVYGHLGFELYPNGFNKHWFGKWINTSVNHNQHHQFFKGNYGLYFTWWDRLFRTIRSDYDARFNEVTSRVNEGKRRVASSKKLVASSK
ncbi:MAG: sterol desaturase family protein [Chitinophagaceae bacterium]|nr:sterol desaturase family protein [Chitinophagaceae bacterium]